MAEQLHFESPHEAATLIAILPDGSSSRITNLPAGLIRCTCPVLAEALSDGPGGRRQAGIEVSSVESVHSLMRYLQSGDYLTPAERAQGPISLLKHAEMSKMAQDLDLPRLLASARLQFLESTELACSVPWPPVDLCETIRYLYRHPSAPPGLLDCLLNYCVSCFAYHDLGTDPDFRMVAYEIPEFNRALVHTSYQRCFTDEGASEIVQLPLCSNNPVSATIESSDYHFGEHMDDGPDLWGYQTASKSEHTDNAHMDGGALGGRGLKRRNTLTQSEFDFALVHRFKKDVVYSDSDLSDDEHGFTLVHRPKVTRDSLNLFGAASSSDESPAGRVGAGAYEITYETADEGDDEGFNDAFGADGSDEAASAVHVPQHSTVNTPVIHPALLAANATLGNGHSGSSDLEVIAAPRPFSGVDEETCSDWSLV